LHTAHLQKHTISFFGSKHLQGVLGYAQGASTVQSCVRGCIRLFHMLATPSGTNSEDVEIVSNSSVIVMIGCGDMAMRHKGSRIMCGVVRCEVSLPKISVALITHVMRANTVLKNIFKGTHEPPCLVTSAREAQYLYLSVGPLTVYNVTTLVSPV
jgi:hypothetical protein